MDTTENTSTAPDALKSGPSLAKPFTFYTTGGTRFTVRAANWQAAKQAVYELTGERITNCNHRVL